MVDYRENVVTGVLLNVLQKHKNSEILSEVLPACFEQHVFGLKNTEGLQDVLAQINGDLNTARHRFQGLLVLQHVLGQCTAEVFSANFHTWLNLILQLLQGYSPVEQRQIALPLLSTMIQKVTAFPELSRDMGTSKVKIILPVLLSLTSKKTKESAVACISSCIVHFPGATSFFKDKIETFLMEELDSASPSQVYIQCYVLLARCGMGSHREKYQEAWKAQCEKVVSTLKAILYSVYQGLESGEDEGEEAVIFPCPVPNMQPAQTACLVRRFSTMCACLAALLREPYPSWVPLNVEEILQLVCRTLAVQPDMLVKKGSTDHLLLLTYLPLMYSSAFSLLCHLIVCAKRLLVSNRQLVMSLCLQCLEATHLNKAGATPQGFRKVRQCVYQTLDTWLQVMGPTAVLDSGKKEGPLHQLLTEIFIDIAPQRLEALQLEKSAQNTEAQPPPKKKRRKNRVHQELAVNVHAFLEDAEDTVCAALKVLTQTITNVAIFMDADNYGELVWKVCDHVAGMQTKALPPYTSPHCRRAVYEVLRAMVSVPRPDPLLLQQAVSLFHRGAADQQLMVAVACREAVTVCQNLIHPRVPCLLAPVAKRVHLPSSSSFPPAATPTSSTTLPTVPAVGDAVSTAVPASSTAEAVSKPDSSAQPALPAPKFVSIPASTVSSQGDSLDEARHGRLGHKHHELNSTASTDRGNAPEDSVSSSSSSPPPQSTDRQCKPPPSTSSSLPVQHRQRGLAVVSKSEESSEDSGDVEEGMEDLGEVAGTSVDGTMDEPPGPSLMETEMNAEVSDMISSFVPCEADPEDDTSDCD